MRLISAWPRDESANSSCDRDQRRLGADDVIERFERFAIGKGLNFGAGVEALLQAR